MSDESSERDPDSDENELEFREKDPQGILYFTRYDSVPILVDALFDSPSSREFTKTELANKADLSQRSVSNNIEILLDLGIIQEIEDTNRYKLNLEGEITWKLRELDGLIKKAQSTDGFPVKEFESKRGGNGDENVVNSGYSSRFSAADSVRRQVSNYAD